MEVLYNGIILPDNWPPQNPTAENDEPMDVDYLKKPPEVILVDIGRQLFVDDFLIEKTNLEKQYHMAKKYEGNPVFYPQTKWEKDEALPCSVPKSGGIWWDKDDKIFKMWYEAGWIHQMAYATSTDGIHWERPMLDIEKGTNKILTYPEKFKDKYCESINYIDYEYLRPDSCSVVIDHDCNPSEKYKMFFRNPGGLYHGLVMTSPDGIHWNNIKHTLKMYDRSTMFYNPFRKKWVFSIRDIWDWNNINRTRSYIEVDDIIKNTPQDDKKKVKWLSCDKFDKPNAYIGFKPQLYNVDAIAYESIMLGMFQIFYGPENNVSAASGAPKITELMPMYSRDGFHWTRPCRKSIINSSMSADSWDRGYVQSVGGVCIIMGDELWIYYSAFKGDESRVNQEKDSDNGMYSGGAVGLTKLRRDGFVSVKTENSGYLLTRKIRFKDKNYLFVNLKGTLYVEFMTADCHVLAKSKTICTDKTSVRIEFTQDFNISDYNNEDIRLKFYLSDGDLYSFWFSKDITGKSEGYQAAGAPLD